MHSASCILAVIAIAVLGHPVGALPLAHFNTPVLENFDSLATATSTSLPADWQIRETGTGANATYAAGSGGSITGNTYSFGASGNIERALGSIRSASVVPAFGTTLWNQTGATITELAIAYTGEQWRLGAAGRVDRLDFAYSVDATNLATGTWIDIDALDFVAPVTTGAVGALNGNLASQQAGISHHLGGLSLAPGAGLMLRWTDFDAAGADDGLAIDDFAITAVQLNPAPVAESLTASFFPMVVGIFLASASLAQRRKKALRAGG